jgi:hypothetical protein
MVPTKWGNSPYSKGINKKRFHNTSFLVAVTFNGLRVHLISPPVLTFCVGISKVTSLSISLELLRNEGRE